MEAFVLDIGQGNPTPFGHHQVDGYIHSDLLSNGNMRAIFMDNLVQLLVMLISGINFVITIIMV